MTTVNCGASRTRNIRTYTHVSTCNGDTMKVFTDNLLNLDV